MALPQMARLIFAAPETNFHVHDPSCPHRDRVYNQDTRRNRRNRQNQDGTRQLIPPSSAASPTSIGSVRGMLLTSHPALLPGQTSTGLFSVAIPGSPLPAKHTDPETSRSPRAAIYDIRDLPGKEDRNRPSTSPTTPQRGGTASSASMSHERAWHSV
ncbi:hypothetical protein NOR_07793 [Metarhizium rileyi]|uniref:Uncharacterized protein n=1 Tax=Metarhizium rileyi (strain RCEF 4871) TaxID=1649241 RepID=A0A166XG80_METRR|nr:hypothetical protein NOR_07793 [Metarhizium rileyi RCEF 4871]TWU74268.1 hypothetical protein ED733_004818 [Metarhizium rileyi]